MINYVYGEQLYQEFVSFRDLFLKKAVARAQHVDTASD
ncbi:phage repressor protein C1, partial [Escherichia coli]